MSILILGSNGSMGKRYQAILKYLGKEPMLVDVNNIDHLSLLSEKASGFIIASPTSTHIEYIKTLSKYKKPILCEKPLSTDIDKTRNVIDYIKKEKINFTMMMQYKLLNSNITNGVSYYNYFRHGSDGLVYDCIQIIALSRGNLRLEENSPIWRCYLNGKKINIADMDSAYVDYVNNWIKKPGQYLDEILEAHEKTEEVRLGYV